MRTTSGDEGSNIDSEAAKTGKLMRQSSIGSGKFGPATPAEAKKRLLEFKEKAKLRSQNQLSNNTNMIDMTSDDDNNANELDKLLENNADKLANNSELFIDEDEMYKPIVEIRRATPDRWTTLEEMQESVKQNELKTYMSPILDKPSSILLENTYHTCTTKCCYCCCDVNSPHILLRQQQYEEHEFLELDHQFDVAGWLNRQSIADSELAQHGQYDEAHREYHNHLNDGLERYLLLEEGRYMFHDEYIENGIYSGTNPLLAKLLLRSGLTSTALHSVTVDKLRLSRMTQRLLRLFMCGRVERKYRDYWHKINQPLDIGYTDPLANSSDDNNEQHITQQPNTNIHSPFSTRNTKQIAGILSLLKYVDRAPMLKVIEDPLNYAYSQPMIDTYSYFKLFDNSQHLELATSINDDSDIAVISHNHRTILRLHVHQLVLTEHPFISLEERLVLELKRLYSQYRSLYDNKMLEYLMLRLTSNVLSLQHLLHDHLQPYTTSLNEHEEETIQTVDIDQLTQLKTLYIDLTETLPALNELNIAIDTLTYAIYDKWKDIRDIRQKQGYINTSIDLSVRKLDSNVEYLDDLDGLEDASQTNSVWLTLKTSLEAIPRIVDSVQTVMFRAEVAELTAVLLEEAKQRDSASGGASTNVNKGFVRSEESGGDVVGNLSPIVKANTIDEQKLEAKQVELKTKHSKTLQFIQQATTTLVAAHGLLPHFVLRLTDEASVTADQHVKQVEYERRQLLRLLKFKLVVKMNGKQITSTDYYHIRTSTMTIDFKKSFEFRVLYQPQDVTLELYFKRNDNSCWSCLQSTDLLISAISVPLPGQASREYGVGTSSNSYTGVAHSLSPAAGWLEFTSVLRDPVGITDQFCCSSGAVTYSRTEGSIYYVAEYDVAKSDRYNTSTSAYDGVKAHDVALLPRLKSTLDSIINSRLHNSNRHLTDFTRENDFQALLPTLSEIDHNDPANEKLLQTIAKRLTISNTPVFHLFGQHFGAVFYENNIPYTNYFKLKESVRNKMLRLRYAKPFLFEHRIPLLEVEVRSSPEIKQIVAKEKKSLGLINYFQSLIDDENEVEKDRKAQLGERSVNLAKVNSFLEQVRNSFVAQARGRRQKVVKTRMILKETDYLAEEEQAEIANCFARKRDLHPKRKKRIATIPVDITSCHVLVQVIGAKNIPLRGVTEAIDNLPLNSNASPTKLPRSNFQSGLLRNNSNVGATGSEKAAELDGFEIRPHLLNEIKLRNKRRARTFVEIRFRDQVVRTTPYEGATPLWKQSLSIPFLLPKGHFNPEMLEQIRDDVFFSLFDEIVVDDKDRGGFLEGENTVRVDKRYLGSFSIPFATVYRRGTITGVFRMDTPAINFGYDKSTTKPFVEDSSGGGMFQNSNDDVSVETNPANTERDSVTLEPHNDNTTAPKEPRREEFYTTPVNCDTFWILLYLWIRYLLQQSFVWLRYILQQILIFLRLTHKLVQKATATAQTIDESILRNKSFIQSDTLVELNHYATSDTTTALKLRITLDPLLQTVLPVVEDVSTVNVIRDDRSHAGYSLKWLHSVRAMGAHTAERGYKVFAVNSNGLNVLLCRYLKAQKPPDGFHSRRACLHLVSTIPFMQDAHAFIGSVDLWCTSNQFWEIGAGDEEEHAVMLYNYLYYLVAPLRDPGSGNNLGLTQSTAQLKLPNLDNNNNADNTDVEHENNHYKNNVTSTSSLLATSYRLARSKGNPYPSADFVAKELVFLAIGSAIPEGDTVYVVYRDNHRKTLRPNASGVVEFKSYSPENYLIMNACSGHVYSALDPSCPLREIYCLVTPYNLWANIQIDSRPCFLQYNVLNSEHWKPYFGGNFPPPALGLNSIQETVNYFDTNPTYCLQIEKNVRDEIKRQFRRWRSKRTRAATTFHPDACSVMEEVLENMETWAMNGPNPPVARNLRTSASINTNMNGDIDSLGIELDEIEDLVKEKLQKLLQMNVLHGSTQNIPFTDVGEVLRRIKTLCVHEARHPDVRFVVGVRAFPLYNNIVSLWIFVGTLEPISGSQPTVN